MKMFLFVVLALSGVSAFANDSSIPVLNVKGVDPQNTPLGSKFSVYGGNTDELFNVLPWTHTAATPEFKKQIQDNYRSITIVSNGYLVNISCAKMDWESGKALANGTTCEFSIDKKDQYFDQEGDKFDWVPGASCQP